MFANGCIIDEVIVTGIIGIQRRIDAVKARVGDRSGRQSRRGVRVIGTIHCQVGCGQLLTLIVCADGIVDRGVTIQIGVVGVGQPVVEFAEADYRTIDLNHFHGGVIYCDIPYKDTTGYENEFDHDEFWKWAEKASKTNVVLVSEQQAPENWKSIWSQPVKRTLDNASRQNITENLFVLMS